MRRGSKEPDRYADGATAGGPFPARTDGSWPPRVLMTRTRREARTRLLRRCLGSLAGHPTRRGGLDPHEAEDLLQGFLTSRVPENLLARATWEWGGFRSFLLVTRDHVVANERRAGRVRKRSQGVLRNLDESTGRADSQEASPDRAFELAPAREVLAEALRRMRRECGRTVGQTCGNCSRAAC